MRRSRSKQRNKWAGSLDVLLPPTEDTVPVEMVEEMVVDDDRNLVTREDRVLLIVEDDATFARIMVDLAHARGMKVVVALRGATAISLAREFQPSAITLDVRLPDMSGWTLLDRIKHDPRTAHIPVHILSGHENNKRGFALGAMTCMPKDPDQESLDAIFDVIQRSMDRRKRALMLVAENDVRTSDISNLLGGEDIEILPVADLTAAKSLIRSRSVDAIVLDCVAEGPAIEFIEMVQTRNPLQVPAVVVWACRNLPTRRFPKFITALAWVRFDMLRPSKDFLKKLCFCCIAKKRSSPRISGRCSPKSARPT